MWLFTIWTVLDKRQSVNIRNCLHQYNRGKLNFEGRIHNLRTTLAMCKQRYLTINNKITILNNLALAPLIYVSSVINTPERSIKEVDTIMKNFIWELKTAIFFLNTLIHIIENGGLKHCDFETKVK